MESKRRPSAGKYRLDNEQQRYTATTPYVPYLPFLCLLYWDKTPLSTTSDGQYTRPGLSPWGSGIITSAHAVCYLPAIRHYSPSEEQPLIYIANITTSTASHGRPRSRTGWVLHEEQQRKRPKTVRSHVPQSSNPVNPDTVPKPQQLAAT